MFDVSPYPPWVFVAVTGLVVLLVGVAKAGFGGGIGVVATPLMSLVVSPLVAAGILLPLLCACDLVSLWHYRRSFHRPSLRMMLPGSLAGIALGTLFLWFFKEQTEQTERWLKLAIGILAILFVVYQFGCGWLAAHAAPSRPDPLMGAAMGSLAGFGSMLAHAGGPPVTIFIINQHLDRRIFVGTTVVFFTIVNFTKLIPYFWLGMINLTSLPLSTLLLPLVPLGVWLGIYLNRRIPQKPFENVIYVILFLTGLQLVSGMNVIDLLAR